MNICIIEDNVIEAACIEKMSLNACNELKLMKPIIYCFNTAEEFIVWFNSDEVIDVCFLDVNLKSKYNGIGIAKLIKEKYYNSLIVFMTSYEYYFRDMIQAEPFRFLEKPFSYNNFLSIFSDIHKRIVLKETEHECIYRFKVNGIIYSADLKNVLYIYSYKRKIYLYDNKQGELGFYGKLDEVEAEINELSENFIRINKSYLVNIDFIESIGENYVSINGKIYTISPKYKINIKKVT